ncbi:MAG: phosphatidylserine decarboxylase family protein [Deltaproteobacteria bacterium]|nr:phosphatidylserine decarboxylase family protein [Deltaproteobacteria bacterium]
MPVALEGAPFILGGAFVTLVFALLGWQILCLLTLALTFSVLYFFRDPNRTCTFDPKAVVAPADGVVVFVKPGMDQRYYQGECVRLSIFMSVLDVHVNRFPVDGTVRHAIYKPGGFEAANREGASKGNEQNALIVETEGGRKLVVVQVAGLIARRIVCWTRPGDLAAKGERFGMIRFGSRVDLYLPPDFEAWVQKGDRVRAGETLVGKLP